MSRLVPFLDIRFTDGSEVRQRKLGFSGFSEELVGELVS
jgi:hypothetical protein